jgi:hypothetical protein
VIVVRVRSDGKLFLSFRKIDAATLPTKIDCPVNVARLGA